MRSRVAAVAGVATAFVLLVAGPAFAHATYKSSDPADDSTVESPPSEVWAEFTEPMSDNSYMIVTDPCGREVGSTETHTANEMTAPMNGVAAGEYSVEWQAASIDGHTTTGEFNFTVSNGEPCPGEEPAEPPGGGGGTGGGGNGTGEGGTSSGGTTLASSGGGGDQSGTAETRSTGGGGKKANGGGKGGSASDGSGTGAVAQPGEQDQPEAPSALEGIPVGGLLVTLVISALIGAAAGKIYVSLSGETS